MCFIDSTQPSCGEWTVHLLSISCPHGPQKEEAPRAAADPDRRDTLHH